MTRIKYFLLFGVIISVVLSSNILSAYAAEALKKENIEPLRLIRVDPAGEDVPPAKQIVFHFNRPVVPLGQMSREASDIPITITPRLKGNWLWLNRSSLAFIIDDADALKYATTYKIKMSPGIMTEDGATLNSTAWHVFTTERPKPLRMSIHTWYGPGMPEILIDFNQAVLGKSIENHIFFLLQGTGPKRIPVKITPFFNNHPMAKSDWQWLVRPVEELPGDQTVSLWFEPGLLSSEGDEKSLTRGNLGAIHTFPEFRIIGIECTTNDRQRVTIPIGSDPKKCGKCSPFSNFDLLFNVPVSRLEIKNKMSFYPPLAGEDSDYDIWGEWDYNYSNWNNKKDSRYRVWLPVDVLKANDKYTINPGDIRDVFGRPLAEKTELVFMTDHRPPKLVLLHDVAVLEKNADTDFPITVTNLEKVELKYDRLTSKGSENGLSKGIDITDVQDIAFHVPLNIREILEERSGAIMGTLDSVPQTRNEPQRLFVQVTPFSVHAKVGYFNTLLWVTDLSTGTPVSGATVSLFINSVNSFDIPDSIIAKAVTDEYGVAFLPGNEVIDPSLSITQSWGNHSKRPFVIIEKGEDFALLPFDYNFMVDTYRASSYSITSWHSKQFGLMDVWGVTAQGVYRAGDTVQYKLYVRNQDNKSLVPAPEGPYNLAVYDPMGKIIHEESDIMLNRFGSHYGDFILPENGAMGWHSFELTCEELIEGKSWSPMRMLVSDFTPSPFRVTTDLNGVFFSNGDILEVETKARLHAGGPWSGGKARISANLTSVPFRPENPVSRNFYFDTSDNYERPSEELLYKRDGELDESGDTFSSFTVRSSNVLYGRITLESSVMDERGKYVAGRQTAMFSGRKHFIGLRNNSWLSKQNEETVVDVLVVNEHGEPNSGIPFTLIVEQLETKVAYIRGAGNAYEPNYSYDWTEKKRMEFISEAEPTKCIFIPDSPGSWRITAVIFDGTEEKHQSILRQWVIGQGRIIWEEPLGNTLEIIPESSKYEVGDTARYFVKNPFQGSKALISIERYGVIESWIETFDSGTPVLEFPIKEEYFPGFYLSVLVVSPRVGSEMPEADGPDLGKPSFRMGYVEVPVNSDNFKLDLNVTTDKNEYKPKDKVSINLNLAQKDKAAWPVECAVIVLDEAVFDLIGAGEKYFDPYTGFYKPDHLDLENYNILMGLVGKIHFQNKGAAVSGDGGLSVDMRTVEKYIAYWNPSVVIGYGGNAAVEFDAPDNITGWRVLVISVTNKDKLGLSQASFKVNRETELRPVMPNQVREGDRFNAGFSVMNRTNEERIITVEIELAGAIDSAGVEKKLQKTITLPSFKRETVFFNVVAKDHGKIDFKVIAGDEIDHDGLNYSIPVLPKISIQKAATFGTTEGPNTKETILFPEAIRIDTGGITLGLSPTVIGNITGAFEYMRDYPYICWEQRLTKGVMAALYKSLKGYMPENFVWEDAESLILKTIEKAASFQTSSGAMTYYIPEDQYANPYLSAYTALAFTWLKKMQYEIPAIVENNLHSYLQNLLRNDILPDFYSSGLTATVRAVAMAALAANGKIDKNDIERYFSHMPKMDIFGKSHFLTAALTVSGVENICKETAEAILAYASQSGGTIVFNEEKIFNGERILSSHLRTQGAVLEALSLYAGTSAESKGFIGDIPVKLARYITQSRKGKNRWENPQENMFCLNGLLSYANIYENVEPAMNIRAFFDDHSIGNVRFTSFKDQPAEFFDPMSSDYPGNKKNVLIEKEGEGRYYYSLGISFSSTAPMQTVNAGVEVKRNYYIKDKDKWLLVDKESLNGIKRGDIVKVELFVSIPGARNFLVVSDPVPGGFEPVNRDLATSASEDGVRGIENTGSRWPSDLEWGFYHQELRHDRVDFYSEHLQPGNYLLSYTVQAICSGEFIIMPTLAEQMYEPDVYGKTGEGLLIIVE